MEEMLWHKHKWPEKVAKSIDFPEEPLFALLDKAADEHGDKVYTIATKPLHASETYSEVRDSANKIANFLRSKGIQKGDRVAIFMPNTPHYPAIFFGILKAGAVAVTCNPQYKERELNFQLKDSGAKAVFGIDFPKYGPITYKAAKDTDVETVILCSIKRYLPKVKAVLGGLLGKIPKSEYYEEGTVFYDDIMTGFSSVAPDVSVDPKEDLALILYTGGTTGVPKGAMLTHYNLRSNVEQMTEWSKLDPPNELIPGEEVFVGALPWYHSYGLTLTMITCVRNADSVICIPDPRAGDPPLTDLLAAIADHKGSILHCVPALYAGIAHHPLVKEFDLSSMKVCASGAAPLPPELAKSFEAVAGGTLFEGYGLTETSPLTHGNPPSRETRKFGSVGLPVPGTYGKIVDLETGIREMPIGEDGEIAISGPQVMKGYWNKPDATSEVMRQIDGMRYFLTGDIGHMDEEGFFVVTDRKKDMVNVGGFKAYPREIEDTLYEHPAIQMAGVVGLPREDDPSNEYVKAFVILKEGETATSDEIIEWCRDRMAGYKRPKEVEIVESLPLSAVGKILRRELRDEELKKRGM
jgi:long-chain acyl-CoA synthetase